jgi:hypothetical protein
MALRAPLDDVKRRRYELYESDIGVPRAAVFPQSDEALVELPDARAYRALSRAGLLLIAAGLRCRDVLAPFLKEDAYAVGIYCALEMGPNDFNCAKQMVDTSPEQFAATYKSLRSAKQYFQQLPTVPPSQLAIFLNVMGPQFVYQHSRFGCLQGLEQAEFDLNTCRVRAALVCSAFSLEDPLVSLAACRQKTESTILSEGAAVLLLVHNGEYTDWRGAADSESCFYGIAHDLVMLAKD